MPTHGAPSRTHSKPMLTPLSTHKYSPIYGQQQKPDKIEQRLNEGRPILDGRVLLRVRCEDHGRTAFVFQTEKPADKNTLVSGHSCQRPARERTCDLPQASCLCSTAGRVL